MSTEAYERKRNPTRSGEPRGDEDQRSKDDDRFVIQAHDASTMHYDFRLAVDGVLKSWAVPKGLSTDPSEKRLAIRTEDHPLDYADFEGVIPESEYGGGTVIVWDRGRFENLSRKDDEPLKLTDALRKGHAVVRLHGEKLQGGYALIRTDNDDDNEKWLIVKTDDDAADARRNPVSTEQQSVVSGRTLSEVADEENGGKS